jgi:hypothetical protein
MFNPQPKIKKEKKPSRTSLVKKLDTEFSIYIRTRFAVNNISTCFTCKKKDEWKKLQCGHFQSRKHYSTRWDETNCQVQCYGCNVMKNGEQYKFGLYLNSMFGEETAFNLMQKAKETLKIKDYELIEKINYYKNKNDIYLHSTNV